MSVIGSNVLAGASGQSAGGGGGGGFAIPRSLRFNSGDSSSLTRTPSASGNRKTWTWSGWVKRSKLNVNGQTLMHCRNGNNDNDYLDLRFAPSSSPDSISLSSYGTNYRTTSAIFRDPSAWFHLVVACDTTQGSNSDRVKLYINGVQQTFSTEATITQDANLGLNQAAAHKIGDDFDGYLADVHFVDGQALAPTDFGETNTDNLWVPKAFAGTYGPLVNQSQTWSSSLTASSGLSGAANAFDGSLSTRAQSSAGTNQTLTFAPSSGVSFTSTLEVYCDQGSAVPTAAWNGNSVNPGGGAWVTVFTGSGTINATYPLVINTQGASQYATLKGVRLDGKLLIDSGVTVTDNSFHLDFADNSSNAALGTDTSGNSNTWTVNNLSLNKPAINVGTISSVGSGAALPIYASWQYGGQSFNAPLTGMSAQSTGGMTFLDTSSQWVWLLDATIGDGTAVVSRSGGQENFQILGTNDGQNYTLITTLTGSQTYTLDKNFGYTYAAGRMSGTWGTGTIQQTITNGSSPVLSVPNTNSISVGDVVQDPVEITAIDTSNNTVTVNGGNWYGSDGSGTSGGSTVLSTAALTTGDNFVDTPTNGATASDTGAGGEITGCYATWNPLDKHSAVTLANGNLDISQSSSGFGKANIHVSSGKWYWEQTRTDTVASVAGIALSSVAPSATYLGGVSGTAGFDFLSGAVYSSSPITKVNSSNVGAQANGSVAGFALDCDNGTLKLYINGVLQTANHITFTPGTLVTPAFGTNGTAVAAYPTNFGQRAFAYAAPSGYKSLNTANLSSTIADGSKYFDTKLYTSNSSSLSVAGYEFSPSFVWIKNRASAQMHGLFDVVRGANQFLSSNRTNAEHTTSGSGFGTGTFNSFDSNGFTLGDDIGQNSTNYPSGEAHVAWAWDAGSSNTTIAVGGENSSVYNFADWESMVTGAYASGWGTTYQTANAFDGNLATMVIPDASQGWTFTPSSPIAGSLIEIYGWNDGCPNNGLVINGNNYGDALGADQTTGQWYTLPYSTLTSIQLTGDGSAGSSEFRLIAIRIDGKMLLQTGTSVTNVPSIASTVRANPSAGFSIVSYTGTSSDASVAHGLNAEPGFIIIKNRTTSGYWVAGHTSIGWDKGLYLNRSDAQVTAAYFGSSPSITTNTFSIGTASGLANANGDNFIAYCFAPVEGYSAMGSYTGNGSTTGDGPFVYTGFSPKFLLIKGDSTSSWLMLDSSRAPYNIVSNYLQANASLEENGSGAFSWLDFTSNGFKHRNNGAWHNATGVTYIYLAFASNPFASNGGLAR